MFGAFRGHEKSFMPVFVAIVAAFFASSLTLLSSGGLKAFDSLGGMLIVDNFSLWMKALIAGGMAVSLMLSYSWFKENAVMKFEIPILYLFSGVGMMLMVSVNNFLGLYVSLELSSLCLYVVGGYSQG